MAGPLYYDRVMETSATTGTGTYTLGGAVSGYQDFSVVGNTNTCYYCAAEVNISGIPSGGWEVGLGTWATGGTLARTTILASSNAGSAVSWAAGTRRVFLVDPAAHIGLNITGVGSAVDGEIALFDGTTGKLLKRATGSGVAHVASGVYSASPVVESDISLSDVTTINASTSAHGLLKKLDNDPTHFMNGQGAWTSPSAGGGGASAGLMAAFTAPVDGDFSWVNQGSATTTAANGTVKLYTPNEGATSIQWRMRVKSAPGSRPYTVIIAYLNTGYTGGNGANAGFVWRESGSGKIHVIESNVEGTQTWKYYTNPTTFSGATRGFQNNVGFGYYYVRWVKVVYSSGSPGTRTVYLSADGLNWIPKGSVAGDTDITPDQIGFGISNQVSATDAEQNMILLSWEES